MNSFGLYDEIIPNQCETKVTPTKIEVKMKKKKPAMWPTRDADLDLGLTKYDLNKAISELCEIEDIPDQEALKLFEQRQNETLKSSLNKKIF